MVKLETQNKRNKAMAYKAIPQTSFEHNECNWGKVISICIHFRPTSISTIQRSSLNTFLNNYYGWKWTMVDGWKNPWTKVNEIS